MMTAVSAGGRLKTGIHFDGAGSPISRVGLTMQQVMGVAVDTWGTQSMQTNRGVTEVIV